MRYSIFRRALAAAAVAQSTLTSVPHAQESSTQLVHRGLVFPKGAEALPLTVEAEQITINPEVTQVKYRISSRGPETVSIVFSLPLPALDFSDPDINWAIPMPDQINFIGLSATIDRRPVRFSFSQSAISNGKDVSAVLRRYGLALIPIGTFQAKLAALPPEARGHLADAGLIVKSGTDQAGNPLYFPAWSIKTTGSSSFTVTPGKTVDIELRHRTSVGVSPDSVLREPLRSEKELAPEVEKRQAEYCIDKAFFAGVDKIVASFLADKQSAQGQGDIGHDPQVPPPLSNPPSLSGTSPNGSASKTQASPVRLFPVENRANIREWRIEYDLAADAALAPIKDFRLVVDKGKPDRIVSFCLDNLRRISPTAFEMRAANFTPNENLKILLLGRE
jgi:Domain of unknown function (DUF4424)